MEELTFGGNSSKRILSKFLDNIALFIKWSLLLFISRSKKISKCLTKKSIHLNLNAQKQVITDIKVNLILRDLKRYRFKCNGENFHCYEIGDYISIYKERQKENLEVKPEHFYYLRFNTESWIKD
tara:strand:+ start:236 stop:610 length:375 start_codon:yes stop_codon:yes gene_type:complete